MLSVLNRFQKGLAKTRAGLIEGINKTLGRAASIDAADLDELEELLLSSDVGYTTTEELIERLSQINNQATAEEVMGLFKTHLIDVLQSAAPTAEKPTGSSPPHVISIVGVNGTGKTTTIGKLAYRLKAEGKNVLLAAADTFRAGAIDQLTIWAERAGADIVRSSQGGDPAAVAFDALRAAKNRKHDVVIIDTAGRLHTKTNLMDELIKIHRVIQREIPEAPHQVLLVIDATTGQNGLLQARRFAEAVHVTGIILTKLDGTAKGGIVFAIARELKLPVRYVGLGESLTDLEPFDAGQFVEALFQ